MDFDFRFGTNMSSGSSIETAGSLANAGNDIETAGQLACLFDDGGMDAFGSKDMFGNVDSMDCNFFANVPQVETVGSMACAGTGTAYSADFVSAYCGGADFSSASCGGGDFGGGAACASVGGDSGGSCGGGSFSSVC